MTVKTIDIYTFNEALDASKPCVVKFISDGCYLCDGLNPIFKKIARKYKNRVLFFNVDVDDDNNKKLVELFSDDGVPTVYYFSEQGAVEIPYPEEPDSVSGYHEEDITNFLNKHLGG